MKLRLISLLGMLLVPAAAFAWGPLTHIYLGNELFSLGALLPAGILEIIRRYRKDFLYGNIMADIILGKKYLPDEKSSHSWEVGFDLLNAADRIGGVFDIRDHFPDIFFRSIDLNLYLYIHRFFSFVPLIKYPF